MKLDKIRDKFIVNGSQKAEFERDSIKIGNYLKLTVKTI
jgi:hypothetical protein